MHIPFKICLISVMLCTMSFAKSNTERAGDILTLLIPAVAYGTTLYTDDTKGQHEFYYSRVHAQKHFTRDVIAGALIGIGFSWYFATPYETLHATPVIDKDMYGVQVNYKW